MHDYVVLILAPRGDCRVKVTGPIWAWLGLYLTPFRTTLRDTFISTNIRFPYVLNTVSETESNPVTFIWEFLFRVLAPAIPYSLQLTTLRSTSLFLPGLINSLRKQPLFLGATSGFPSKWSLSRKRTQKLAEIGYWWRVITQIWIVLLVGRVKWEICFQPIRSSDQICVVTRHQYGISAKMSEVSQQSY